jgi:MFS family permease
MSYLGEVRINWRYITAAGLGQTAGYSVVNYINNLFTPHFIEDFGWTRADIAGVGVFLFLGILAQPIAGRLTDTFGVRRVAIFGVVIAPLVFVALGAMTGALWMYALLIVIQVVVVGGTTSATIYSRLIAQQLVSARGIALAISAAMPAAIAAACIPFLAGYIETNGWRAGYIAVAVGIAIAGISAIALIPASSNAQQNAATARHRPMKVYLEILRTPAFKLIIAAMVLCNLSFTLQTTQLKVILLDNGMDSASGTLAVSLFAFSVIVGRVICGLALDRFPAYIVTAISMGLPGIGLAILATGSIDTMAIAAAVMMLGFTLGAESDVLAYLSMKYFRLEIYSTVLGMILGTLALAIATGSFILSLTLKYSGGFTLFLTMSSIAALIGAGVFLLLRRVPTVG